jgi:hypothetical protein
MEKTEEVVTIGKVILRASPMPALEVSWFLTKLLSGAGSQRNAMANSFIHCVWRGL